MESNRIVVNGGTVDQAISKGLAQLNLESHDVDIEILSEGRKGLFGIGQKDAEVSLTPKNLPEMSEPGNIQVFENEERVDYISEHEEEENLDSEEDNYVYSDTITEADEDTPDTLTEVEFANKQSEEDFSDGQATKDFIVDYLTNAVEVYGASGEVTVEETKNAMIFHIASDKPGLIIGKHGKIINALQSLAQTIYQQRERKRVNIVVNVGDYRERRANILSNIADRTAEKVTRTKQPVFLEPLPSFERKQIHARLSKNKNILTHSEGKEPHRYLVVEINE